MRLAKKRKLTHSAGSAAEGNALSVGGSSSSSKEELPLSQVLNQHFLSNKLSAKDVAELARSAKSGGNSEESVQSMAEAGNWGKAQKLLPEID